MDTWLIVVLAVAGFIVLLGLWVFNRMIGKRNAMEAAFANVDVALKKRYDLIPNLVSTVKTYMKHEEKLLTEITEIRAKAIAGNPSIEEKMELDGQMTRALGGLTVAVEAYPDLKASQNFLDLQGSLNVVEEQAAAARRSFNDGVRQFNNALEMFPGNLMAGRMGMTKQGMFQAAEEEKQPLKVASLFEP